MDRFFIQNSLATRLVSHDDTDFIFSHKALVSFDDNLHSGPIIIDSGIDFKSVNELNSEIYTTIGVIYEDEKSREPRWTASLWEENRVLDTYTGSDLRDSGNVVYVAGNGIYEGDYTSITNETQNVEVCPKNGLATMLVNNTNGSHARLCSHLSDVDIGILVHATAFPFWVITNDKCLLWCSSSLGSYRQEGRTKSLIRS